VAPGAGGSASASRAALAFRSGGLLSSPALLPSPALSLKRPGLPPGDATAEQMDGAAALAERYSAGELRVTHDQNLLLPWVPAHELRALWLQARDGGFATPNIGLLTDLIACPGGDLCALANARSIPIAAAIAERFDDLDRLHDIGDIDLHISGCINSCGHHHSGHIGILGVDKDGSEWYQLTVAGSDGSTLSGAPVPGKVLASRYHPGKFLVAWHPKSSTENERTTHVIEGPRGPVMFRQIAGALARRICWYMEEGMELPEGEEVGFIKFGSRIDVFLPLDAEVCVEIGAVVRGRETVLARMK
jgi:sulfite reductase (NADPH) hemoprotein beta-component